jgi:hypothetical protein
MRHSREPEIRKAGTMIIFDEDIRLGNRVSRRLGNRNQLNGPLSSPRGQS